MIRSGKTICAPATPPGGAISVIRMSGPGSLEICDKIFTPADSKISVKNLKGYTIVFGEISSGDEIIDDVLVSIFKEPHSYTGEDSVEISCHGSSYIQQRILELLVRNGASAAQPGEFTFRAFMNGKMDLSQAEAVADLVASSTRASHDVAINQIRGGFSSEIAKLRKELLHFTSLIELELDFGEEDVEFADRDELMSIITKVKEVSDKLALSFMTGNVIKNGIPVAIVGKPNSGKSTLLNALLNEEKALVSEIPGTTRDIIEDTIIINGIEYRFIDTAGLHDTPDIIENLGIRKTHEKLVQASVIMMVDEINDSYEAIIRRTDEIRKVINDTGKKLCIIINKVDLAERYQVDSMAEKIKLQGDNERLFFISARENSGLDELREGLSLLVEKDKYRSDDVIITNIRHYEALFHVSESLSRVIDGLGSGIPQDLIATDIRQAIHYLGEITGEITTDEILGNIFRNFCIGK